MTNEQRVQNINGATFRYELRLRRNRCFYCVNVGCKSPAPVFLELVMTVTILLYCRYADFVYDKKLRNEM